MSAALTFQWNVPQKITPLLEVPDHSDQSHIISKALEMGLKARGLPVDRLVIDVDVWSYTFTAVNEEGDPVLLPTESVSLLREKYDLNALDGYYPVSASPIVLFAVDETFYRWNNVFLMSKMKRVDQIEEITVTADSMTAQNVFAFEADQATEKLMDEIAQDWGITKIGRKQEFVAYKFHRTDSYGFVAPFWMQESIVRIQLNDLPIVKLFVKEARTDDDRAILHTSIVHAMIQLCNRPDGYHPMLQTINSIRTTDDSCIVVPLSKVSDIAELFRIFDTIDTSAWNVYQTETWFDAWALRKQYPQSFVVTVGEKEYVVVTGSEESVVGEEETIEQVPDDIAHRGLLTVDGVKGILSHDPSFIRVTPKTSPNYVTIVKDGSNLTEVWMNDVLVIPSLESMDMTRESFEEEWRQGRWLNLWGSSRSLSGKTSGFGFRKVFK